MRTLTNAQHERLDRIGGAYVIGWDGDRSGPVLQAGSMLVVVRQDGNVVAR